MGAAVGFANGLLITRVRIDAFIATLGRGTILYGLNAWYTGGQHDSREGGEGSGGKIAALYSVEL